MDFPPAPAAALIAPTASGKSHLALPLAEQLNAEIISVDSGAVYRQLDIGTAKPDRTMQQRVAHHLIDIVDPSDTYNVARFYHDAVAAVATVRARGKTPLFVGGSMMYFNVLMRGLTILPPVPAAIENTVRKEAEQHGVAALYEKLKKVDATAAAALKASDRQRIIRAYSLYQSHGQQRASWQQQYPPLPLKALLLIPADRTILRQRLRQRLQQMWEDGLLAETRHLLEHWQLAPDAPPLKMAGYCQAKEHLQGKYDIATMQSKAYYATSQLAKRQLTWLQKWRENATVLDPFNDPDLTGNATRLLATQ